MGARWPMVGKLFNMPFCYCVASVKFKIHRHAKKANSIDIYRGLKYFGFELGHSIYAISPFSRTKNNKTEPLIVN